MVTIVALNNQNYCNMHSAHNMFLYLGTYFLLKIKHFLNLYGYTYLCRIMTNNLSNIEN